MTPLGVQVQAEAHSQSLILNQASGGMWHLTNWGLVAAPVLFLVFRAPIPGTECGGWGPREASTFHF